MPYGRPRPLGRTSIPEVVAALYALHDRAEDPRLDRFPEPEDLIGVLTYTGQQSAALRDALARAESTRLRLILVRHLRVALDVHELKAIHDGRSIMDGSKHVLSWAALAPMLGVDSRNGALLRAQRLEVAKDLDPEEQRTPEALRRRRAEAQRTALRHGELTAAVRKLLSLRHDLPDDPDLAEDLDDIAALVEVRRPSQRQQASLAARLRLLLRDIEDLPDFVAGRSTPLRRALGQVQKLVRT